MSFGLNPHSLPYVSDFNDAVATWQEIKPLRNSLESDPRPLGRRESRNAKQVRAELDPVTGEPARIIFRYHHTDVVTWHKDNTCVINPWPSQSTATFANALLPRGVYICGECSSIGIECPPGTGKPGDRRHYRMNGLPMTLWITDTGDTVPLPNADEPDGTKPVIHTTIDVKAANALYKKYNLNEFEIFYDAFMATTGYEPENSDALTFLGTSIPMHQVCEALTPLKQNNRDQWAELAKKVVSTCAILRQVHRKNVTHRQVLRWMIRGSDSQGVYKTTPVYYTHSLEQLRRIEKTDPSELKGVRVT